MNLVQRMNPFFWLVILAIYSTSSMALSVELIETSPKSPVILNQDEALYVLIRYKSDQPLRFQAIGENLRQKIMDSARFNPSQAYPAGEGEAIAWVAYYIPQKLIPLLSQSMMRIGGLCKPNQFLCLQSGKMRMVETIKQQLPGFKD